MNTLFFMKFKAKVRKLSMRKDGVVVHGVSIPKALIDSELIKPGEEYEFEVTK